MRKKRIYWFACDLLVDLLLVCLSGDLLYLYWAGAWYDPILWIEITEIIMLWLVTIIGLFRFWLHLYEFAYED